MLKIKAYSHGCCLMPSTLMERRAINAYVKSNLYQTDKVYNRQIQGYETEHKATFASANPERTEYRILRSDLEPLLSHLEFSGIRSSHIEVEHVEPIEGDAVSMEMRPQFVPRDDDQREAIAFALEPNKKDRVLHARTGFGKTFCGFYAATQLKKRTALIMEPGHIKTWVKCIDEYTTIKKEDVLIIQGSESMRALMNMRAIDILEAKLIFMSAATLRNYIKDYESADTQFDYPIPPVELLRYLGIGLVIRDESHESIHSLCKQVMYSDVARIIYLSATLVSDDRFINRMYERVFPIEDRWESKPNKHIDYRSVFYRSPKNTKLKFRGFRGYSHTTYEKSILKTARYKMDYWHLIKDCIEDTFVSTYKPKLKLIIFCATKKMCQFLADSCSKEWPQFTVGCYIAGAKDEELYDRDIVFSTPKGAGTGVDIPNLEVAWNTVAIGSTQLHRQIAGRLRPIKEYEDLTPRFYMLFNDSIPQHIAYEKAKRIDSIGRSKSYERIDLQRMAFCN